MSFTKHLVLLGAGPVHTALLDLLATQRRVDTQITMIAPVPYMFSSAMLPGHVAGHYSVSDCQVDLQPLLQASGARYLAAHCMALNPTTQKLTVMSRDGEHTLPYHALSLDVGPVLDRELLEQEMPGARSQALYIEPEHVFARFWSRLVDLASTKPLSIVLIGHSARAVELATAVLDRLPRCRVTLVRCWADEAESANPQHVLQNPVVQQTLKARHITVLQDRCVGIEAGQIVLASGTTLACDAPLLIGQPQLPRWLTDSGLALNEQSSIAVNNCSQSTSHPQVFWADEADSLLKNLRAVLVDQNPVASTNSKPAVPLLYCGDRRAMVQLGRWSLQGRWVWHWKDRRDRPRSPRSVNQSS